MEKNYDNLIGYEVGVLDESLKECKKITIKSCKYSKVLDEAIFVGDDDVMYKESELNWTFTLTHAAIMLIWLKEHADEIKNVLFKQRVDLEGITNSWLQKLMFYGVVDSDGKNLNMGERTPHKEGDAAISLWMCYYYDEIMDVIRFKGQLYPKMDVMDKLFNSIMDVLEGANILKKGD